MRLFIETRGRTIDYEFLGEEPRERWWREYRDHTSFERPTILVRSTDGGWEAYLGGIPSARMDLAERTIRFTVAMSGQPADEDLAYPLLLAWLAGATGGGRKLQDALDGAFDEGFVERTLAAPDRGDAPEGELESRLADVLARLGAEPESPGAFDADGGTWLGSAGDAGSRRGFLAYGAAIMGGRARGRALLLNIVRGTAAAAGFAGSEEAGAGSVILAANPTEEIEGLVRLPAPAPLTSPPPPGAWPAWAPAVAIVLMAVGVWAGYEVLHELWRRFHR